MIEPGNLCMWHSRVMAKNMPHESAGQVAISVEGDVVLDDAMVTLARHGTEPTWWWVSGAMHICKHCSGIYWEEP